MFSGNCAVETQQSPRRKKARAVSKKAYDYLVQSYVIRLCCDDCIVDQPATSDDSTANGCSGYYVRVPPKHTDCRENRLVLQEKQSNLKDAFSWRRIRACPPDFKSKSGVCDKFLNGEPCPHRNRCRFPHSAVEGELWTQYFKHTSNGSSITVEGFIDDLRNSSLRMQFEVEQMWQKLKKPSAVELKLICKECWKKGNGEISVKRSHAPECQKGHRWNDKSKKLILDFGDERTIDLDVDSDESWTEEECIAVEAIRECQKRLSGTVTDEELISEMKRVKQQEERIGASEKDQRRHLLDEHWQALSNDDNSISGSYGYSNVATDDEGQVDVEEDLSQIYADDDLDDIMTVCSSDLDSSDDEAYAEDPYYQLKPVAEARELLNSKQGKYKRCLIHLDGPFSAKCRMLDDGFRVPRVPTEDASPASPEGDDVMRDVEIRGRANCGPCFDGDEVVVKLKKTKELDGDKIIYRGSVVAVLAKKIRRKAHTFVCRVDTYHSHLMKPLDGVAPKIHVVNSILKKKYPHRKDELVAVYSMVDKNLKLQKIVKLDPLQRRDMLFVVK